VRHGLSTFNVESRYQGSCDEPELTEPGRVAARLTAQALAGAGIQLVISSPLRRALATAREILDEFYRQGLSGPELRIDERLREIDLPEWQGLSFEEVKHRFSEQYGTWRSKPHLLLMRRQSDQTGFPVLDLFERVRLFWNDLLSGEHPQEILVVAHGGSGRALMSLALGIGPQAFHSLQLSHGGISAIEFCGTGCRRVEILNSVCHLAERLPKVKAGRTGLRLVLVPMTHVDTPAAKDLTVRLLRLVRGDRVVPYVSPGYDRLRESMTRSGDRSLETVLSAIPQREFCAALAALLPINGETAARFHPRPARLTVIHYPGKGEPAVLQAVNLLHGADDSVAAPILDQEGCFA
jgi:probable phosphoglycerate mutase